MTCTLPLSSDWCSQVDQQSEHIRRTTGLSVGSYCGADGVDDWSPERWSKEIAGHQVLVLIHQVTDIQL